MPAMSFVSNMYVYFGLFVYVCVTVGGYCTIKRVGYKRRLTILPVAIIKQGL